MNIESQALMEPGVIIKPGVDIIEIDRIKSLHEKWGDSFLERIFTPGELDYCMSKVGKYGHLAGRFAAKEAVIKILKKQKSPPLKTIEIVRNESGCPAVELHREAADIAEKCRVAGMSISISHSKRDAVAFVIALLKPAKPASEAE